MAEWSNAPDSKSGVQVLLYRGFESLSFRQFYLTMQTGQFVADSIEATCICYKSQRHALHLKEQDTQILQ